MELTPEADAGAQAAHAEIAEALKSDDVRLALPVTFTHGRGVQVMLKSRKVGPILLRSEDQSLADMLYVVGRLAEPAPPRSKDEPTDPGWYAYSSGAQVMVFHLRKVNPEFAGDRATGGGTRQWSAHFDTGRGADCAWGYIEQALGVWDLVPLVPKL